MLNDEIFKEVFASLRETLTISAQDSASKDFEANFENLVHEITNDQLSKRANQQAIDKAVVSRKFEGELGALRIVQQHLMATVAEVKTAAESHLCTSKARLAQQRRVADKRLQELVFEVIGEYQKTLLRAEKREQYLRDYSRVLLVLSTWSFRWQRFLMRLEYDIKRQSSGSTTIRGRSLGIHLLPRTHAAEIIHCAKLLSQRLSSVSTERYKVLSVIRFKTFAPPSTRGAQESKSTSRAAMQIAKLAQTREELIDALDTLQQWQSASGTHSNVPISARRPVSGKSVRGGPFSAQTSSGNGLSLQTMLSSDSIAWMQPASSRPGLFDAASRALNSDNASNNSTMSFYRSFQMQHASSLYDRRVYVCLEERILLQGRSFVDSPLKSPDQLEEARMVTEIYRALQNIYCATSLRTLKTLANASTRSNDDALSVLHDLLQLPLEAIGFRSDHRGNNKNNSPGNDTPQQLMHWPDIVIAHPLLSPPTSSASVSASAPLLQLHFAPACVLQLLEQGHHPIQAPSLPLYCLTVTPRTTPLLLSPSATSSSSMENEGEEPQQQQQKTYTLLLPPLSSAAHSALRNTYLSRFPSADETTANEYDVSNQSTDRLESERWTALQLLPHHSRIPFLDTLTPSSASSSTPLTSCHYALCSDDNNLFAAQDQDSPTSPAFQNSSLNNNNGGSVKRSAQPCLYLVQLQALSGENPEDEDERAFLSALDLEYRQQLGANEVSSLTLQNSAGSQPSLQLPMAPTTSEQKREWDVAVLADLCYWRACLCRVDSSNSNQVNSNSSSSSIGGVQRRLCGYHRELRAFLDADGGNESAKYLPKKPPALQADISAAKRDLLLLRGASTLLQELWDGRLKSTVKLFARKMLQDLRQRTSLETALQLLEKMQRHQQQPQGQKKGVSSSNAVVKTLPSTPSWLVWRGEEQAQRTLQSQRQSLELLQAIRHAEASVAQEIERFLQLRVFPNAELIQIRRDIKAFKELQEQVLQQVDGASSLTHAVVSSDSSSDLAAKNSQNSQSNLHSNGSNSSGSQAALLSLLFEEHQLCDRKLSALTQRRMAEEEAQIVQQRRAQQRLAREAEGATQQTRDSSGFNFRNQGSRF